MTELLDIDDCASCHNFHNDVEVTLVDPPIEYDLEEYDGYFLCPMTGETVFVQVEK